VLNKKNKGIRARWVTLLATKGNWTNKGCKGNAVRNEMMYCAKFRVSCFDFLDFGVIIVAEDGCWEASVFGDVEEGCPFVYGGIDFGQCQ
jgi:hypothetical protein